MSRSAGNHPITLVVGGVIPPGRRAEIEAGRWPRADVLELEASLGARLIDLASVGSGTAQDRLGRALAWLAGRVGFRGYWLALYVLLRTRRDDVVYAAGEEVGVPLGMLARLLRRRRRLVMRLEDPLRGSTPFRHALSHAMLRFALPAVARTLCRTSAHAQYLDSTNLVASETIAWAPESTDTRFFDPDIDARADARAVVPDVPYAFSAGVEMRDYATLIQAFRGLELELVIAAGSRWSAALDVAGGRELPANVRVVRVGPAEMRELYRSAEVVVLPLHPTLRSCGISVLLEAWAMERAVVATRTAGLQDYATDGADVLFHEPGDARGLRALVLGLLERPDERRRLASAGRERSERCFQVDRYVGIVERELRAAAAR